jgi:hypothetical protein
VLVDMCGAALRPAALANSSSESALAPPVEVSRPRTRGCSPGRPAAVRAGWSQLRAVRSINSVAAKMRASLMVEAELLVEGQVVLDRDGCDVYLALARQLADTCSGGGSRGPSRCRKGSSPCSVGQEATKRLAHWERRVSSLPYEPVFLVCLGLMTRSRLATYSQPNP